MPQAKHREPIVPEKMKIVIKELVETSKYDLAAAAAKAGLTTARARRYLKLPHVARYMREERNAVADELSASNPMALAKVRDSSDNGMAVVAAVRGIEQLRQTAAEETRGGRAATMPGLVIVITQPDGSQQMIPPAPAPMIDVTPERETLER